jgi:hypothetical protein
MEPIDIAVEGLPLRKLLLVCYLVTWMNDTGFQIWQGVPIQKAEAAGWPAPKTN